MVKLVHVHVQKSNNNNDDNHFSNEEKNQTSRTPVCVIFAEVSGQPLYWHHTVASFGCHLKCGEEFREKGAFVLPLSIVDHFIINFH